MEDFDESETPPVTLTEWERKVLLEYADAGDDIVSYSSKERQHWHNLSQKLSSGWKAKQ